MQHCLFPKKFHFSAPHIFWDADCSTRIEQISLFAAGRQPKAGAAGGHGLCSLAAWADVQTLPKMRVSGTQETAVQRQDFYATLGVYFAKAAVFPIIGLVIQAGLWYS